MILDVAAMKATVIVSSRGSVALPAGMMRALGLRPGDRLHAEIMPEGILLRPAVSLQTEVYTEDRIRELDEVEAELGSFLEQAKPVPQKQPRR